MDHRTPDQGLALAARHPGLLTWGLRAWLVLGIALAGLLLVAGLSQVSGLVVPLVVAAVIGALLVPLVDVMDARGVPRAVASTLVMAGLAGVLVGSGWLVVAGIIDQGAFISAQLSAGIDSLRGWLADQGLDLGSTSQVRTQLDDSVGGWVGGLAHLLPGIFSGVASFVLGAVIGTFLLFYILLDWRRIVRWLGGHVGLDPDTGARVLDDAVSAVRAYFASLTISAVVTAVLIGAAALVLDVPLAFAIALVTLVTSYIPYLGAIVSGAFAMLIALGAQGPQAAIVMLAVILVVQNIVQTVVLTKLTSDALSLHPIVALGSTIVGAALAGALGATLSSPAVAVAIRVRGRLRDPQLVEAPDPAGEDAVVRSPGAQA